MINKKPPDEERVTSVIPIWTKDVTDEDVSATPMGTKGQDGVKLYIEGPEYGG